MRLESWKCRLPSMEGWYRHRVQTADCTKKHFGLWSVDRRRSVHSGKELYRMAKKRRFECMMKTEVIGAEEILLQQRSKKALMEAMTM